MTAAYPTTYPRFMRRLLVRMVLWPVLAAAHVVRTMRWEWRR